MKIRCPYCSVSNQSRSGHRQFVLNGHFKRKSDSKLIQRFSCMICRKSFSTATFTPCYRQKKRRHNERIRRLLASGVSQRRLAKDLKISRLTVVRKFLFLGRLAEAELERINRQYPKARVVQFDDLITIEHTKCKPLSCTVVVEEGTRRILGLNVAKVPANGHLAHISRKKYGPRRDEARKARLILFKNIRSIIDERALIKTDEWPQYPPVIKTVFPRAKHETFKSKRAAIVGQGELKKCSFDPIFSVNHTLAMLRANVNRLFRRSWNTTKKPERLLAHLMIYAVYHNTELIKVKPG